MLFLMPLWKGRTLTLSLETRQTDVFLILHSLSVQEYCHRAGRRCSERPAWLIDLIGVGPGSDLLQTRSSMSNRGAEKTGTDLLSHRLHCSDAAHGSAGSSSAALAPHAGVSPLSCQLATSSFVRQH